MELCSLECPALDAFMKCNSRQLPDVAGLSFYDFIVHTLLYKAIANFFVVFAASQEFKDNDGERLAEVVGLLGEFEEAVCSGASESFFAKAMKDRATAARVFVQCALPAGNGEKATRQGLTAGTTSCVYHKSHNAAP